MIKTFLKKCIAAGLCALLLVPGGLSSASAAEEVVSLVGLDVSQDEVKVRLSGPVRYSSFLANQSSASPRLVLELLNTETQIGTKSVAGQGKYLSRVRSGQFERSPRMIARVVVDMSEKAAYQISSENNIVLIKLGGAPQAAASAAPQPVLTPKPVVKVAAARPPEPGSLSTETSSELGAMAAQLDVTKAAVMPVKAAPAPALEVSKAAARKAQGDILSRLPRDLVTLDFENTDIKDIIKLLAAKAKVNIIHGGDVTGTLSLHLVDVPFNEAFRTILTMMGLSTTQVGDSILRVLTPATLAKEKSTAVGVTKIIPLSYTKAAEMLSSVNSVRQAENRSGVTIADAKTNSLIVTESPEGLIATEQLIAELDVKPKQVIIEVKLIEVSYSRELHYGISWNYFEQDRGTALNKQGLTTIGSHVPASPTTPPFDQAKVAIPGGGTGVNLPATAAFGALTLGRVTNNYFLNATLAAAAASGKLKVLSDPKIATLNNQPANINITRSTPYVTNNVTATGVSTPQVAFVNTGITLSVTPSINADGRISLDLNPSVSQPGAIVNGVPSSDARSATTKVIVRDGETIVIGGLISDRIENNVSKVPILGDIPLLGWLFKKKDITRSRVELLIFVTPKIID